MNDDGVIDRNRKDQTRLFDEICQDLIEAGYYRVLRGSLSRFDTVVGGVWWLLSWLLPSVGSGEGQEPHRELWELENLRVSYDEREFRESATISHRISTSERTITLLSRLSPPLPEAIGLEPHQIQGLDYPVLKGVVGALCGRVRRGRGDFVSAGRRFALVLYDLTFANGVNNDIGDGGIDELADLRGQIAMVKSQREMKTVERDRLRLQIDQVLDDKEHVNHLESLISSRDNLTKKCAEYREKCKVRLKEIKRQIKLYELHDPATFQLTPEQELDFSRLSSLQEKQKNLIALEREYEELKREYDDVPHDSDDLRPIQKQFASLYAEMSRQVIDLKQKYTHLNTLTSITTELNQEILLDESVLDNIFKTTSKANQGVMIRSLQQWLQATNCRLLKVDAKLDSVKKERDVVLERYNQAVQLTDEFHRLLNLLTTNMAQAHVD